MPSCGFSERTFEFCFNAEFCNQYSGLLAAHPTLPSQRQEKYLGYDVEFKIKSGSYCNSLFLQHKAPHFAGNRVSNNRGFYDTHGGPYFRFRVDTKQHNTMVDNISTDMGDIFYCAPLFNTYVELASKYDTKDIVDSSIWIDPNNIRINDNKNHNITYDPVGDSAYLHSKPTSLKVSRPRDPSLTLTKREIDSKYISR